MNREKEIIVFVFMDFMMLEFQHAKNALNIVMDVKNHQKIVINVLNHLIELEIIAELA